MNKQITVRHMEHSPVIDEHINKQLERIEKFLSSEPSPIHIHIVVDAARVHHHHTVEASIKSPHYTLHVTKENADMYAAIDESIKTLYELMQKSKKERIDKEHHTNKRSEQ